MWERSSPQCTSGSGYIETCVGDFTVMCVCVGPLVGFLVGNGNVCACSPRKVKFIYFFSKKCFVSTGIHKSVNTYVHSQIIRSLLLRKKKQQHLNGLVSVSSRYL